MRSGLMSLVLVTIALGFVVGVYTTIALPPFGRAAARQGVAGSSTQVSPPVARPWRGLVASPDDNLYGQPVLLVGVVATIVAIIMGFLSRSEGDYGARPVAETVITLAVVALMLLAIEMLVSLLIPVLV